MVLNLLNVKKVIAELVLYYQASGRNAVVALQARRIGYCIPSNNNNHFFICIFILFTIKKKGKKVINIVSTYR